MRKLLIVLLGLGLGATCLAQSRGGFRGAAGRGFGGGHGFSGGYGFSGGRGFVGGAGFSGRIFGARSYGGYGWGGYGLGRFGGYGSFYGYGRGGFAFGLGIGIGYYPAWTYWDYDPYGYPYSYGCWPYGCRPYVSYPAGPPARPGVVVYTTAADPAPGYAEYAVDGRWHRFGERVEVAAAVPASRQDGERPRAAQNARAAIDGRWHPFGESTEVAAAAPAPRENGGWRRVGESARATARGADTR